MTSVSSFSSFSNTSFLAGSSSSFTKLLSKLTGISPLVSNTTLSPPSSSFKSFVVESLPVECCDGLNGGGSVAGSREEENRGGRRKVLVWELIARDDG